MANCMKMVRKSYGEERDFSTLQRGSKGTEGAGVWTDFISIMKKFKSICLLCELCTENVRKWVPFWVQKARAKLGKVVFLLQEDAVITQGWLSWCWFLSTYYGVSPTFQACSLPRVFSLAVPSAWNALPLDSLTFFKS